MNARLAVGEQVWLVAGLRWRVFVNSLRTIRGRLDAVSQALLWLVMAAVMFGGGFAIGFGAYALIARGEPGRLSDLFWPVLLFWQFYPILSGAGGARFDFANLLRFPLRYASFYALSLAYGLFDPTAVISLFWLLCLSVGVALARPALFPWAALVVAAFAAMNLTLSRAVATWADRWLEQRRTREILGLILILGIFLVQFGVPAFSRWATGERFAASWRAPVLGAAHVLDHVLPPGLAGAALANGAATGHLAAFANFLCVCLYALAFFWLLHLRLAAQYRGENLSETLVAPSPAGGTRTAGSSAAVWRLPWRSSQTAALVEREARYTMRNWPVLFQLVLPAFFVLVLGPNLKHTAMFGRDAGMAFPIAVAYAFFIQTNWIFNSLGYEGAGIRFLLLAPVRFRQVIVAKNLFQCAAMLASVLLLWLCVRWLFGPVNLLVAAATLVAALFGLLVNLTVGNVISIRFPTRREISFGNIRRGRSRAGTAGITGLLTEIVLIASAAAVFLTGKWLDRMGLAVLIFSALAVAAAIAYAFTLRTIDRLALGHRENLIEELCRTEAAS